VSEPDASPASPKVDLWTDLRTLLDIDRIEPQEETGEVVEEILQSLGTGWMLQETLERVGSRRSSLHESQLSGEDELKAALRDEEHKLREAQAAERAMEIDFEAKEKLVQNLMEERKLLRAKTEALNRQLEQGVAERWLGACFGGISSLFGRKEEGSTLDAVVEALEEKAFEEEGQISKPGAMELRPGQLLLDGHFAGRVVTKAHCLEIAMPIAATMPGTPVVELIRAVRDALEAHEASVSQQRAEVVGSVLTVVEADVSVPEEAEEAKEVLEAEEDSQPTVSPQESRVFGASVVEKEEAVSQPLEEMSKELAALRSESSRMQREAEQLRLKNTALVTFLSSAERSAAKLRAALTEAGISQPLSSPETSPKVTRTAAREPDAKDLAGNIKELETWATRLRNVR